MKNQNKTNSRTSPPGHTKHIAMMAVCCGLPILLLAGVSVYGIASQSLETLILLICPIGMGAMLWMMMRSDKPSSTETVKTEEFTPIVANSESASNN